MCQTSESTPTDQNNKSKLINGNNKENISLKKFKMPKRNVISKIKTMLESGQNHKDDPENEVRKHHRTLRKNNKWDAVMNKIEAGKTRVRPQKKEVKSRVLQGLTTSSSTASTSSNSRIGDANNNANNNSTIKDKRYN